MQIDETVLLADGARLECSLRLTAGAPRYRLRYGRAGDWTVQFDNLGPRGHRQVLRGSARPYAFRSVEQLRYDFEQAIQGS
jgi:hypothetical protein